MGEVSRQSYPGSLRHGVVIYYFMLFCINSINLSWLICQLNADVCRYSYLSLYQCFCLLVYSVFDVIYIMFGTLVLSMCFFCIRVFIVIFSFYLSVLDPTSPYKDSFNVVMWPSL